MKVLLAALFLVLLASGAPAGETPPEKSLFADEDALNLYCLKKAYPEIDKLEAGPDGDVWLIFKDGRKALYSSPRGADSGLDADVKTSLAEPYPLEPSRPVPQNSPGRKRSYELFRILYGNNAVEIQRKLQRAHLLNGGISLSPPAARAFKAAVPGLEELASRSASLRSLLKPDGGYYWRKIAGEKDLSAHSFGIALDLGASKAPYWRWHKNTYHPMQASYPPAIVKALEKQGFIWGGKWREYDLMHFEYRPEIICKAQILQNGRP